MPKRPLQLEAPALILRSLEQRVVLKPSQIVHAVFRSAVDIWAIQQLFPIMPLHRLDEEPNESATLADITCDSDGKIDRFISPGNSRAVPAITNFEVPWPFLGAGVAA